MGAAESIATTSIRVADAGLGAAGVEDGHLWQLGGGALLGRDAAEAVSPEGILQEGLVRLRPGNDAAETAAAAVLHVDAASAGPEKDETQDADQDGGLEREDDRFPAGAALQDDPCGEEEQQRRLERQQEK